MKKFLKKALLLLSLPKAFDLVAKEKYIDALQLLLKHKDIAKVISDQIPDYYMLLGEIYARLGEHDDAICYFSLSWDILLKTKYYNNDEKNYLKKYIIYWLTYISRVSNAKVENIPNIEGESINHRKIRKAIKIHFPLD